MLSLNKSLTQVNPFLGQAWYSESKMEEGKTELAVIGMEGRGISLTVTISLMSQSQPGYLRVYVY